MYDDGAYRPRYAARPPRSERIIDWLRGRPAESWAFFAAGFALAAILT